MTPPRIGPPPGPLRGESGVREGSESYANGRTGLITIAAVKDNVTTLLFNRYTTTCTGTPTRFWYTREEEP